MSGVVVRERARGTTRQDKQGRWLLAHHQARRRRSAMHTSHFKSLHRSLGHICKLSTSTRRDFAWQQAGIRASVNGLGLLWFVHRETSNLPTPSPLFLIHLPPKTLLHHHHHSALPRMPRLLQALLMLLLCSSIAGFTSRRFVSSAASKVRGRKRRTN